MLFEPPNKGGGMETNMKIRKLLSMLMALVIAVAMVATVPLDASAAGDTNAKITAGSVEATPGATVNVDISIADNPGIMGTTLKVEYGDKLVLKDSAAGDAFSALTMTKPGKYVSGCKFIWDAQELETSDIKDGAILSLTFEVSSAAAAGESFPVNITCEEAVNSNLDPVSVDVTNGAISIPDGSQPPVKPELQSITAQKSTTEYHLGDTVTVDDIVVTARYSDGSDIEITDFDTDVDQIDTNTPGEKTLTVTYTEDGKTAAAKITITVRPILEYIDATKTKTAYDVGETLNLDDITVTGFYSDGSSGPITNYTTNAASIDMSKPGTPRLVITYEEDGTRLVVNISLFVIDPSAGQDDPSDPGDCDHVWSDWYPESSSDKHYRYCLNCNDEQREAHVWNVTGTYPATLTNNGTVFYKCNTCGATKSETLPAAKTGKCGENLTYEYDSEAGLLIIRGTGAMDDFEAGKSPFCGQNAINEIAIEEGVTYIGAYAFEDITMLYSLQLPVTIEQFGKGVFTGCNVEDISYAGTKTQFGQIKLGDSRPLFESASITYNKPVSIAKKDIANVDFEIDYDYFDETYYGDVYYDYGYELKPWVYTYDNVYEDIDYEVTYKNNINVGTAKIIITGIGRYTGTKILTFNIIPLHIEETLPELLKTKYTYTGSYIKPKPSCIFLKAGEYGLSYKNNKKIGKATVTITGKKNYKGSVKMYFTIVPAKGAIKKLTPAKKAITVKYKALKGGVKYQVQYKLGKGKWKSKKTSKTSLKISKLKSKKKYSVRVRGYKKVGSKTYYGSWSKVKTVKTK